jgi:hypothetical protein
MSPEPLLKTIEIKDRTGRVIATKEVVTYPGLLSKAHDEGLAHIRTSLVQVPSDENGRTAIVQAEVETGKGTFSALGDASPESVTGFLVPHLIRMAETRAKARALRDAVNIGVVSFEELDGGESAPGPSDLGSGASPTNGAAGSVQSGPAPPAKGSFQARVDGYAPPMTEAQRRYLFRILAGWGLEGDAAHAYLKDVLDVSKLTGVSKLDATKLIDRLLKNPPSEVGHGASQHQ